MNDMRVSGADVEVLSFIEDNKTNGEFCFKTLMPEPEYTNSEQWFDWRCANWGVKWDVDGDVDVQKIDEGFYRLYFTTPWEAPLGWFKTVAAKYPKLKFELVSADPGLDWHFVWQAQGGMCLLENKGSFEDNAEFGLGIKLATDMKRQYAISLLKNIKEEVGTELVDAILCNHEEDETQIIQHRLAVNQVKNKLKVINNPAAALLSQVAGFLEKKSMWIVGGDGWAYDIGFSGLDHVLSTGENVNILVLDTEVYSNTGGQKSKSSPIGASAKFSVKGKTTGKKDLAMQAMAHGNAYVAEIAMGANDVHALKTILEAEAFPGPSIIIAYSHCIAHGYDMCHGLDQQALAVKSGYWPLFRFNPMNEKGKRFMLDSKDPSIPMENFMYNENRFATIKNNNPERAHEFLDQANQGMHTRLEKLLAFKNL